MSRIAIFVDGAYLRHVLKEAASPASIDFAALNEKIRNGKELLRTYYYDCLPWRPDKPTPEERTRFSRYQRFYDTLVKHTPRFQVRLGKLARRHENGRVRYEQKQVDILLCVDLIQLAAKHRITDAALVAGDSDFLPAVEVARREGVVIHLFHGRTPHDELLACCDERIRIDASFIDSVRKGVADPRSLVASATDEK